MKLTGKIVITVLVENATEEQIDAFVTAALVQSQDLEDDDGNPLGDLPVTSHWTDFKRSKT